MVERGEVERARKEATLALRIDPKQGRAYCALARIAVREGKDDEALMLLNKAIRLDDTDADALMLLGDLSMRKQDYPRAVSFYRRVTRVIADESECHRKLMEAHKLAGDNSAAEREGQVLVRLGSETK